MVHWKTCLQAPPRPTRFARGVTTLRLPLVRRIFFPTSLGACSQATVHCKLWQKKMQSQTYNKRALNGFMYQCWTRTYCPGTRHHFCFYCSKLETWPNSFMRVLHPEWVTSIWSGMVMIHFIHSQKIYAETDMKLIPYLCNHPLIYKWRHWQPIESVTS